MKTTLMVVVVACVVALGASCATVSVRPCADSPAPAAVDSDSRRFTFSIEGPKGWVQVNDEANRLFANSISMAKGDSLVLVAFFPSDESVTSSAGQLMTVALASGSSVFELKSSGSSGREAASFRWRARQDMGKVEVRRLADGLVVEIIGVWAADEDAAMRLDFDRIQTAAKWEK